MLKIVKNEGKNGRLKNLKVGIQDNKADKEVINIVIQKLDKIENLLLDHMSKK